MEALHGALASHGVSVAAETSRGALKLIAGSEAYIVHGSFNPEMTLKIFNDAIEQANTEGFTGFRARKCRGHLSAKTASFD